MWFIGVEVEQETGAPPPKKNPGSAPARIHPSLYGPGAPLHDPRVHGKFLPMLDAYNQGPYILEYYPIFTPVCMALERLYIIPEYMVSSWLC